MVDYSNSELNIVLSGGGIKGIAFVGALEAAQNRGYRWGNIAGVSAGAVAGSFIGAGYRAEELKRVMEDFDFGQIAINEIPQKVPAISMYMNYASRSRGYEYKSIEMFLSRPSFALHDTDDFRDESGAYGIRGKMLNNVVTYSKQGSLYDGDFLEEWVTKVLLDKGIKTFADLRGGRIDEKNPRGYKVRMTAVDANRAKIIVLPDDIEFYGIDPDRLEVAKAVRMSTSVPFVFKPVELKKTVNGKVKKHYIVDGGVFDNLPFWLIGNTGSIQTVCLTLDTGSGSKPKSPNPLNILKWLISAVHDIGVPQNPVKPQHLITIDTSKVSLLDFNLSDEEKEYLYMAGKDSADKFFKNFDYRLRRRMGLLHRLLFFLFGKRR